MKNKALVSIVIPIYNASRFLNYSLNCLRKQTYKNIEIICVDDGSSDNSVDIIDSYVCFDPRFKIIKQQNLFAGIARNTGLKSAVGEYVLFVDADDLFSKRMVELFVKTIEHDNSDVVICNYSSFSNSKRFAKKEQLKYAGKVKAPIEMKEDLFQMTIGAPWNKFYKKSFLDKIGLSFQGTFNSNDIFFTRLTVALAKRISFINNRLIYYRVYNGKSLQGNVNKSVSSFAVACLGIINEMKKRDLFETYKDSIQKYATDLCFTALEKANTPDYLKEAFYSSHDVLSVLELESLLTYDAQRQKCVKLIVDGNYNEFLEEYFFLSKSQMVYSSSIEYRIGTKVLSFFGIKK